MQSDTYELINKLKEEVIDDNIYFPANLIQMLKITKGFVKGSYKNF